MSLNILMTPQQSGVQPSIASSKKSTSPSLSASNVVSSNLPSSTSKPGSFGSVSTSASTTIKATSGQDLIVDLRGMADQTSQASPADKHDAQTVVVETAADPAKHNASKNDTQASQRREQTTSTGPTSAATSSSDKPSSSSANDATTSAPPKSAATGQAPSAASASSKNASSSKDEAAKTQDQGGHGGSAKAQGEQKADQSPKKVIKCLVCSKQFAQASSLRRHRLAVHQQVKPHVCRYGCGYRTNQKSNLRRHELIHSKRGGDQPLTGMPPGMAAQQMPGSPQLPGHPQFHVVQGPDGRAVRLIAAKGLPGTTAPENEMSVFAANALMSFAPARHPGMGSESSPLQPGISSAGQTPMYFPLMSGVNAATPQMQQMLAMSQMYMNPAQAQQMVVSPSKGAIPASASAAMQSTSQTSAQLSQAAHKQGSTGTSVAPGSPHVSGAMPTSQSAAASMAQSPAYYYAPTMMQFRYPNQQASPAAFSALSAQSVAAQGVSSQPWSQSSTGSQ